jgi:hypothetical protein
MSNITNFQEIKNKKEDGEKEPVKEKEIHIYGGTQCIDYIDKLIFML